MTTKHPRLNITLDPVHLGLISQLAEKKQQSMSMTARELILQALELEEDFLLSQEGDRRATTSTHMVSHDEAWS